MGFGKLTGWQQRLLVFVLFVIGTAAAVWNAYSETENPLAQGIFYGCWLVVIVYVMMERARRSKQTPPPDDETQ